MKSILRSTLKASALCSMLFLYQLQAETIEVQVTNGMDDIEEHSSDGHISSGSSDLEMTWEHDRQIVGIRFPGLAIPPGATITKAYIQFFVDETRNIDAITQNSTANLKITAENSADAPAFARTTNYLSNLPVLGETVTWNPPTWNTINAHGTDQQTSDISSLIQSIVDNGWQSGNAIAFLISGTGKRVARSSDNRRAPNMGPILHVEYSTDNVTPPPAMAEAIVADYRMDSCTFDGNSGDTKDATGQYNATSKNGVVSVAGKINQAASLSGENDYIQMPTLPAFDKGITISAWVNFDDISIDSSKYEHIVDLSSGLCDNTNSSYCANDYISLWRDGEKNVIRFQIRQRTVNAGIQPSTTAQSGMHHYVGTFDYATGKAKIYVDGILKATRDWNTSTFDPTASRTQNFIGKTIWDGRDGNLSTTEYPFNGKVDEVKLFNGALTATQIQKLFNNENNGKNYDGTTRETVTCTPQTDLPTVFTADNNCSEGDSGTTGCTFTVALSSAYSEDVHVDYATQDGNATAGNDYNATSGTLKIPAGQTTAPITVPIIGDTIAEANETFFINLSNATTGSGTTNLPEPFAWYKFDEAGYNGSPGEVHNSGSVSGADGTAAGASITTSGKDGNAASFDGNSMINFGDVLNPGNTNQWTISGWINWDGTNGSDQQILGKDQVYQIVIDPSGHLQYALAPHWAFDGGNSFTVTPNEWTHFTLTYDGANQKLYKNGTLVYSRPQSGNIGTSSSPLTVGAFHNGNFAYRGLIDDIRMYNQALDATQIQALNNGDTGEGTTLDITVSTATGIILNDDVQTTSEQNNTVPHADDINVTVDQNDSVEITLSGYDPDNNVTLKYSVVKKPSDGNLTGTAPNLTYTPNSDFNGTDSFTYVASDGDANSSVATVTITVNEVEAPVDNAITITEDSSSGVGCAGQAISLDTNQTVEINGTISDVWQSDRYSFLAHEPKTLNISVKDKDGNALEFYVIRNCYEQIKPNSDGDYELPENCGLVTIMVVGCQNDDGSNKKYTVTITQQ